MERPRMFCTRTAAVVMLAGLLVLLLTLLACSAKATPTPTPRPPTATPVPATPTRIPVTPTPVPPTATPVPKSAEQVAYEKALADFKVVEEAANKEGLMISFNSGVGLEEFHKAFNKSYPKIRLEFMDLTNPAVTERVRAERAVGIRTADIHGGGLSMCVTSAREGDGVDFDPPALLEPGVQWTRSPRFTVGGALIPGFNPINRNRPWLINTNLVPPAREPKRC